MGEKQASVREILEGVEQRLNRISVEPMSPVESNLLNIVQILTAVMLHQAVNPPAPQRDMQEVGG